MALLTRLLDVIADVAGCAGTNARRDVLRRHADLALRAANEGLFEADDRAAVARHHAAAPVQLP